MDRNNPDQKLCLNTNQSQSRQAQPTAKPSHTNQIHSLLMEPQLSIFDALRNTPQEGSSSPGEALKAAGMAQVLENAGTAFVDRACAVVQKVHGGQQILAEDWRITCQEHGVTPHHVNGWGALTSSMARRGIIRATGQYVKANSKRNHSHPYQLWEVVTRPLP